MDLDLRKLRYFVAVAEHLNFTRAAEDLHVAQPVLSRQIRALEHDLGAELFLRDKQRTILSAAGSQLLEDAPALLGAAAAARRRVAVAGRGDHSFTIGFMPGLTITEPVRALRSTHPHLQVNVVRTGWENQVSFILDGRIDVGYTRLPINESGLEVVPLFEEPRVAILPQGHPLAGASSLTIGQLAQEHLLQDPSAVPEWATIAAEMRRAPHPDHLAIRTVEERMEMVAGGQGILILPRTAGRFYRRSDLVVTDVTDLAPNRVALAWDAARSAPIFAEFAALAVAFARDPEGE
jgi:DNA-binding transcriptional LysR family regulator